MGRGGVGRAVLHGQPAAQRLARLCAMVQRAEPCRRAAMSDFDILAQIERKVGRAVRHEIEGESVVGLGLTSDEFVFPGLIRHHTISEKAEILALIARLASLRRLDLRRCMVFAMPEEMSNLV